jgi:hypothetical protein
MGSLLQMQGDFARSNKALDAADILIDQLYTKSVTGEVTAMLSNDLTLPYSGEDFEQVYINVLKCLNYLYLGDWINSQVEARKVNNKLNLLSDKYGKKAVFAEDALARYLSAFAYEAGRNTNDAFIDYKNSFKAYAKYQGEFKTGRPDFLLEDLWRTGTPLGMGDQVKEYLKDTDTSSFTSLQDNQAKAEVLFVVYDGLAPFKISTSLDVWIKDSQGHPYLLKVAFPKFVKRPYRVKFLSVYNGGTLLGQSRPAEDIAEIAVKNLEQRIGFISAKAIARATAKYLASQEVDKAVNNPLFSFITNVYTLASETADTRSWRVLPARFHLARVLVPAGSVNLGLSLQLLDGVQVPLPPVALDNLKSGDKRVIPVFFLK